MVGHGTQHLAALRRRVLARRQPFCADIRALTRSRVFDSWQPLMEGMIRGLELASKLDTRGSPKLELLVSQPVFLSWNPFYATLCTFLRCPSHRTYVLSQGDAARAMTFH
jgi:hypothetical protein